MSADVTSHTGDHAFDHGHQRAAVRLPGGGPSQHASHLPMSGSRGLNLLEHAPRSSTPQRGGGGHAHRRAVRHRAHAARQPDHPHSAVSSGARQRRQEPHVGAERSRSARPQPIASLTSPAPIAAGATRCTSRYSPGQRRGPGQRGQARGRPTAATASTIATAPGSVSSVRQPALPDVVDAQRRQPGQHAAPRQIRMRAAR